MFASFPHEEQEEITKQARRFSKAMHAPLVSLIARRSLPERPGLIVNVDLLLHCPSNQRPEDLQDRSCQGFRPEGRSCRPMSTLIRDVSVCDTRDRSGRRSDFVVCRLIGRGDDHLHCDDIFARISESACRPPSSMNRSTSFLMTRMSSSNPLSTAGCKLSACPCIAISWNWLSIALTSLQLHGDHKHEPLPSPLRPAVGRPALSTSGTSLDRAARWLASAVQRGSTALYVPTVGRRTRRGKEARTMRQCPIATELSHWRGRLCTA